ncbi:MAG: 50S ribosomal protein L11 methyltransferase [Rhodobacteraceae bacterium]|nr:50S ribosomal protein L11 methyltransferase [Paracoccaceae bacterium]
MVTYSAMTILDGIDPAIKLADAMQALDPAPYAVGHFEIEDGSNKCEVGAHFLERPDPAGLALLAVMHGARDFTVSEVPEIDWVSKVQRDLPPVVAGRFFVYGSHDADKVPAGCEPLLIEAAMAFGTGHHGTTLGCLRALDRLLGQGVAAKKVADIGCGTAVLAMAAAKVWPQTVIASDIDEVAVDVALANVKANGLEGRVNCVLSAGFEDPRVAAGAPYDLIFANILKAPLINLAPSMGLSTAPAGYVILSGLLNEQANAVLAAYKQEGFELTHAEEVGEWSTLTLRKKCGSPP